MVINRNFELLSNLEPPQVAKYLKANDWQCRQQKSDRTSIWFRENEFGDRFEILLPLKPEIEDFAVCMSYVLETLAAAEGRMQLEILGDLLAAAANVEVRGIVTDIDEVGQSGKGTMRGCLLGKLRKIYLELAEPEYQIAVKAYRERIPIVCWGDASKQGQAFVLSNLRNFKLDF